MTPDHLVQTELRHAGAISGQRGTRRSPSAGTLVCCETLPYETRLELATRLPGRARSQPLPRSALAHGALLPSLPWGARLKTSIGRERSRLTQQTGIPVIRTERGGSITYHGPGQLVGYPILRLSDYCAGPKTYVHPTGGCVHRHLGRVGDCRPSPGASAWGMGRRRPSVRKSPRSEYASPKASRRMVSR